MAPHCSHLIIHLHGSKTFPLCHSCSGNFPNDRWVTISLTLVASRSPSVTIVVVVALVISVITMRTKKNEKQKPRSLSAFLFLCDCNTCISGRIFPGSSAQSPFTPCNHFFTRKKFCRPPCGYCSNLSIYIFFLLILPPFYHCEQLKSWRIPFCPIQWIWFVRTSHSFSFRFLLLGNDSYLFLYFSHAKQD